MAKRELSNTLKNLKFMQRATKREEKVEKIVEEKPVVGDFPPGITKKCIVIMEGDPHPGAVSGWMSFGSFNTSADKPDEDGVDLNQAGASGMDDTSKEASFRANYRENGSPMDEAERSNTSMANSDSNGHHKRKHSQVEIETEKQNNSPKLVSDGQHSTPNGGSKGHFKKPKQDRLDWNVLRRKPK